MYSQHKNKLLMSLITISFLLPLQAFSHDANKGKQKKTTGWSGKFSLSLSSAEGNTNKNKINSKLKAVYKTKTPLRHKFFGSVGISKVSKGRDKVKNTTKDQTVLRYTAAYALNKNNIIAAYVGRETDKQAKLKSQLMLGMGYERRNLGTEHHRFAAGIGAGGLSIKYTDGTPDLPNAAALRSTLDYEGKITDNISLNEQFVILKSKDFTRKRITSSLDYAITEKASVSLSHQVTIDSVIPKKAIDRRDNETLLSFNVKF